ADRVEHILQSCGLGVVVFGETRENPTTRDIDRCLEIAKSAGIDTIVGLGGGSSMDTAKGCNFILTNGGRIQDYWGVGKASNPKDLEARGRMLLGAALAGTAIENSMLGAVHAAANPLTAHYGVVHGEAVGIMLPHVIRFNAKDTVTKRAYAELASAPEIACV